MFVYFLCNCVMEGEFEEGEVVTIRDGRLVEIYVVKAEYDGSADTG